MLPNGARQKKSHETSGNPQDQPQIGENAQGGRGSLINLIIIGGLTIFGALGAFLYQCKVNAQKNKDEDEQREREVEERRKTPSLLGTGMSKFD